MEDQPAGTMENRHDGRSQAGANHLGRHHGVPHAATAHPVVPIVVIAVWVSEDVGSHGDRFSVSRADKSASTIISSTATDDPDGAAQITKSKIVRGVLGADQQSRCGTRSDASGRAEASDGDTVAPRTTPPRPSRPEPAPGLPSAPVRPRCRRQMPRPPVRPNRGRSPGRAPGAPPSAAVAGVQCRRGEIDTYGRKDGGRVKYTAEGLLVLAFGDRLLSI